MIGRTVEKEHSFSALINIVEIFLFSLSVTVMDTGYKCEHIAPYTNRLKYLRGLNSIKIRGIKSTWNNPKLKEAQCHW